MRISPLWIGVVMLGLIAVCVHADLLDCDEKILPKLADIPHIGPKIASSEDTSGEHEVKDFFKNVGCKIKHGATKVTEQARKLGAEIKESAKKFGEKAKDIGSDIQEKFVDLKDKLTHDSAEEHNPRRMLANVEIINPDILKAEQQCGHGHILDALGNCSELRN